MPDIDSLSVNITSSYAPAVNSINKIIASLNQLNDALNSYSDGSQFIRGMNSLSGGLRGIASAVNSIDVNKIKDLSSALTRLGNAGTNVARLNSAQAFVELGTEAQKAGLSIDNLTKNWARDFDIPKNKVKDLKHLLTTVTLSDDDLGFSVAGMKLEKFIKSTVTAQDEIRGLVREYLNLTKINLTSDFYSNFGDDAKHLRGVFGIANTGVGNGTDFMKAMEEMNAATGASIDLEHGLSGAVHSLADLLDESKNVSGLYDAQKAMDLFRVKIQELYEQINKTKSAETNLGNSGQAINGISNALSNMESKLSDNPFEGLVKGLTSLNDISVPEDKIAGLSTLSAAISRFGNKNAALAVTTIPMIGKSFAKMAAELSSAPEISENLVRLAEALSQYSASAKNATASTTNFGKSTSFLQSALTGIHLPTMRAHRGFTSLAAIFGRLYANFFLLIRGAKMLGRAMEYSSSMTEAANVVSVVFGKQSDKMDEFAQTAIKDFGLARLSATQFASRFQAMGSTMGITAEQVGKANDFIKNKISGNSRAYSELGDSIADMSINMTKLTADIASLYNQNYEDVAADMQAVYTGMTRPLRKYGLDLTQATLKEWALANGLDANIEKMTQAEKTLLRYQYVMSKAAGAMGDFQKTADTWANSLRTVKQYLQELARTIGEALINALKPALIAFRNFLANFLKSAQDALNALGKLLGWKQIDFGGAALVEETEDYADALDDAAGAAKKLKGQLRGIDELNNLTSNNNGGGSGSGLSSIAADIASLWDQIDESDKEYQSTIKSWHEFGRKIANAIKDGLTSIDWPKIFKKATTFGTNLASFLNGLIDPDTWQEFGKTLSKGIKTAIKFAFAFGEQFDWENLGDSIAEGINGFFEEFDGGELADTIDVWVQGIGKTLEKAAKKIKWDKIFVGLIDFFGNIDIETINITILGVGTVTLAAAAIAGIVAAISSCTIAVPAIALTFGAFYITGTTISELLDKAFGEDPVTGESYWYEFWETIFDAIVNAYVQVFGDKKLGKSTYLKADEQKRPSSTMPSNLPRGDREAVELPDSSKGGPMLAAKAIYGWEKDFEENTIKPIVAKIYNKFFYPIFSYMVKLDGTIKGFVSKIVETVGSIPDKIQETVSKVLTIIGIVERAKDAFTEKLRQSLIDTWDNITEDINKVIEEKIKPIFTEDFWKGVLKGIVDAFKSTFGEAKLFAKNFFNDIIDFAEKFINGMIDGFNKLSSAKGLLTGGTVNSNIEHIKIPRFAEGGYPQVGSLFWAGEAGSEMVGSINGRTGVVSNGEITGIADAIRSTSDVEIQLLRQQNSLLQGILNKEFGISKDNVFRSVRESAREYSNMTGRPAFV